MAEIIGQSFFFGLPKTMDSCGKICLAVDMSEELVSPHLPAVGLVAQLTKEDRDTLSSYGQFHLAKAGEVLVPQGQPHGRLFFIISGLLHAVRKDEDREVLLGSIRQGEWVGEVDLFDPMSAVCSVVVIEPAQYWVVTRADIEQFINNYPEAGMQLVIGVASTLSKRLRVVTKKLMDEAQMAVVRASLLAE
jgi:CRP/FNR family cyclic AMP-dependent transcriptional regulator